jgi:hypothetical protein
MSPTRRHAIQALAATAITGPNVLRSVVITSQVSSRRVRTPAT